MFQVTEQQLDLLALCIGGRGGFAIMLPNEFDPADDAADLLSANISADDLVDGDLLTNKGTTTINGRPSRMFAVTPLGRMMFSNGQFAGTAESIN